jgi:hypothetical protein
MTRFPPNVEQITIERKSTCTWLIVRRNDVELRFPLTDADCSHLAKLLSGHLRSSEHLPLPRYLGVRGLVKLSI